jgi:hypothetical protein
LLQAKTADPKKENRRNYPNLSPFQKSMLKRCKELSSAKNAKFKTPIAVSAGVRASAFSVPFAFYLSILEGIYSFKQICVRTFFISNRKS